MGRKSHPIVECTFNSIVGGGQAIGTMSDGRKLFAWGVLPGETALVQLTKQKANFAEGIATEILQPSTERVTPKDPESYLSTSPWQIMSFAAEQHHKAALIDEAFALHHVTLPGKTNVYTNNIEYQYRNKVEFSWYGETIDGHDTLQLAFFQRGGKGKLPVETCGLLPDSMMQLARTIRDTLQAHAIQARALKTLLIRCNQQNECVWQLYVKDESIDWQAISDTFATKNYGLGHEIIYSDPRSPASRITKRLANHGAVVLRDTILGVPFRYATEGFFQVNIPVYEQALRNMHEWVSEKPTIDLYSGVGSIGLTIGGKNVTLVEVNEDAVREMKQNITELDRDNEAKAVLAASEKALDYITRDTIIIVDPPRAGLHTDVIEKLLGELPPRIIYLSCNPVTQARDVALLLEKYTITHHQGYNFFPRTPHIEHLVVLDV